jgi:hypothetical protein
MTPVRITRHAYGPRVYVAGLRVHEGTAGIAAVLAAAAVRCRRGCPRRRARAAELAAVAAAAVAWRDRRDFPFTDSCNHDPRK